MSISVGVLQRVSSLILDQGFDQLLVRVLEYKAVERIVWQWYYILHLIHVQSMPFPILELISIHPQWQK